MKKVAIYVRVSTQEQAVEGYSISEQIDRLTKFCEAHSWKIYKAYTHDKRMNDCLPPILFSAIFKLLKVLPDTELDAC